MNNTEENTMNDITQPLVLSVGSHKKGSGRGCAMNVISWENGDTTITDFPDCSDPFLAKMVQRVNDSICTHGEVFLVLDQYGMPRNSRSLCPDCSVKVLDLAHRTVGTHLHDWPTQEWVYITIALERAQALAVPGEDSIVKQARALVQGWLHGESRPEWDYKRMRETLTVHRAMLQQKFMPVVHSYPYKMEAVPVSPEMRKMHDASASAADFALEAVRSTFQVFSNAFNPAEEAATCGVTGDWLARAHKVIDRFEELTGVHATPVQPEVTACAITQMLTPVNA